MPEARRRDVATVDLNQIEGAQRHGMVVPVAADKREVAEAVLIAGDGFGVHKTRPTGNAAIPARSVLEPSGKIIALAAPKANAGPATR
jgi:hypothetical protein